MPPEKGNAPQALAGKRGAIAKQTSSAGVSVAHKNPFNTLKPYDPAALALLVQVSEYFDSEWDEEHPGAALTDDDAAQLLAADLPIEICDVEVRDDRTTVFWSCDWLDAFSAAETEGWMVEFNRHLGRIREKATGADRVALERVHFFCNNDTGVRTRILSRVLPTSAEYAAIAACVSRGA